MKIPRYLQQVIVALHHGRVVSPLVEMAGPPMALVKGARIAYVEMPHELGEIRPERLDKQMEVVGHQHVAKEPDIMYLEGSIQQLKEREPVSIIFIDRASLVSPAGNMIVCSGKLYP
jgi:hypothetical protein